ncbi:RNA polymerase factor sigma-54 [Listeria floridensis FSL S10-1187]|uniref:RNA polymerase factor sigma-54 n=1 Tax=Listeria floridensis FSL S10-1187 TaxID=1265817 RepID=A0ABP3AUE9_9LIST|nr:RNA polymerase factor sigma-54 [Listeria floridensis]EUJ25868.1 RNA polymerase factor sigma-54 [Listeria floridensis FSL S10-1187]
MRLESNFVQKQAQKQTMKLAMTQQLSQSIAMLQFTAADLTTFLEEKALENPLIEVTSGDDVATDYSYKKRKNNGEGNSDWLDQVAGKSETLSDHLRDQTLLLKLSDTERRIVLYLIESLDSAGYLTADTKAVSETLDVSESAVLDGLSALQGLEPAGVAARNLQECILLQIERSSDAPYIAYDVIAEHFDGFVDKKWKKIAAEFGVELSDIQAVFDYVRTLKPKPGAEFESETVQYIVPDLILTQAGNEFIVSVAKRFLPQIRFEDSYYQQLKDAGEKDVSEFLKEKAGEYDWLVKGMEQREDTIQRVGKAIIEHQKAHFIDPKNPLAPLTLKEIAEELGVHESTVSRAVNGKYLETTSGVFELKSFFSSGLQMKKDSPDDSGDISSTSIKEWISEYIDNEDKKKPLSDQKIVEMLLENGVEISRRAVAKYRTELLIPSSSKRKRFD